MRGRSSVFTDDFMKIVDSIFTTRKEYNVEKFTINVYKDGSYNIVVSFPLKKHSEEKA